MAATRKVRRLIECENGFCERTRHYAGSQSHIDCLEDLEKRKYAYRREPAVQYTQMVPSLKPAAEAPIKKFSSEALPGYLEGKAIRAKDFNKEGIVIGITPSVRPIDGVMHYEIVALQPVTIARLGRTVPAGTRGGWVADPENMSPNSWVDAKSTVGKNVMIKSGTLITNSTIVNDTVKPFKIANSHLDGVRTPGGKASGVIQNADVFSSVIAGPVVIASVNNGTSNDIMVNNSYLDRTEVAGEKIRIDSSALPGALIGGVSNPKDTIIIRGVKTVPASSGKPSLVVAASRVSLTSNMAVEKDDTGAAVVKDKSQAPELSLNGVIIKGSQVQIRGNHAITSAVITGSVEHPARIVNTKQSLVVNEAVVNPGSAISKSSEFVMTGNKPHVMDASKSAIYEQKGPTDPAKIKAISVPKLVKKSSDASKPVRPVRK